MNDTILIADDDPEIREMVGLSLKLEGFSVDTVSSGERVLQWVQERPAPSLLILDLAMPGSGAWKRFAAFAGRSTNCRCWF